MQDSKADDRQIFQLIKERMDEFGVTVINIAEQNIYLAKLIEKGIAGYPVTIEDDDLYSCAQLLGLVSHRHASGKIPSRDALIALFEFGELSQGRQNTLIDWGC